MASVLRPVRRPTGCRPAAQRDLRRCRAPGDASLAQAGWCPLSWSVIHSWSPATARWSQVGSGSASRPSAWRCSPVAPRGTRGDRENLQQYGQARLRRARLTPTPRCPRLTGTDPAYGRIRRSATSDWPSPILGRIHDMCMSSVLLFFHSGPFQDLEQESPRGSRRGQRAASDPQQLESGPLFASWISAPSNLPIRSTLSMRTTVGRLTSPGHRRRSRARNAGAIQFGLLTVLAT